MVLEEFISLGISLSVVALLLLGLWLVMRKSGRQMNHAHERMDEGLALERQSLETQQETNRLLGEIKTLLEDRKS